MDSARIKAVVIIASDSRSGGARRDLTGPAAAAALGEMGVDVIRTHIVPDDEDAIAGAIQSAAAGAALVITAGGTGLAPRDVTPEATKRVIQREVPGIPEMLRRKSGEITPRAALSRGIAGILGRSLVINLPGSPRAVTESLGFLAPVLDHAVETLLGRSEECAKSE